MKSKIYKILILSSLFMYTYANVSPSDNSILNYTQIFFSWEQVPNIDKYELHLIDMSNIQVLDTTILILSNSYLFNEGIQWGTSYIWKVCGLDTLGQNISCSDNYNFTINPLPNNYPNQVIVSNYNESLSQQGITFLDFESLSFSAAINYSGEPVWFANTNIASERFAFRQFLNNGHILGLGPWKGYEIDLNSNIVFQTSEEFIAHHDFHKTSKNTYMIASYVIQNQYCPEECNEMLPDVVPWKGDEFIEFDDSGNILWSWNTFDYIDSTEYNPYFFEIYTGFNEVDWTHSNSMFYDKRTESILVSIRNLSRITKIDYLTKDIVWNLGDTNFMNEIYFEEDLEFSMQHSIKVLDNGNLMLFDNHRYQDPELSRCLEFFYDENDYSLNIVWEYTLPQELYTATRGECNRLDSGNTLITAGTTGNAIEVSPDSQVVWQISVGTDLGNIKMDRSERVDNLYPVAFSFTIDEYLYTENEQLIVKPDNSMININLFNSGWSEGWYVYHLQGLSDDFNISDSIYVQSYNNITFQLDMLNAINSNYNLDIYPSFAKNKSQSIIFTLENEIFLGDMNNDEMLNILDIILLSNFILSGDDYNPVGDLNHDGNLNIFDIINLINLII